MREKLSPRIHKHLRTLQRYMRALDTGDLVTLAAVLSEAEQDPALECLLLETNAVYQSEDYLAISQEELANSLIALEKALGAGLVENHLPTPALVREKTHLFLQRSPQEGEKEERIMDDPKMFTPTLVSKSEASTRPARGSRLQVFAAILGVCVLVGGFLFVFNTHRSPSTTLGHTASHTAIPTLLNLLITSYVEQKTHTVNIAARRADNGMAVWNYDTHSVVQKLDHVAPVIVQDQVVYVTTNGQVYAFYAQSGKLIWHTDLHLGQIEYPIGNITYDHGMVYLAYEGIQTNNQPDPQLYALTAKEGTLTWHHLIGADLAFTASDGIVYIEITANDAYAPGSVVALHGNDGSQLWSRTMADPFSLLVANNTLYMLSGHVQQPSDLGGNKQNKSLSALNAANGHFLWSTGVEDDGADFLVSGADLIVLYSRTLTKAQFCAYHGNNGSQAWCTSSYQGRRDRDTAHYQMVNGTLFATYADESGNQTAEAINLSTGSVLWSKQFTGGSGSGPMFSTVLNGTLYFAGGNDIIALRANDGYLLWQVSENGLLSSITANA